MKSFKVRRFHVDRNLGYLIQQTTQDSTQEILAYFYGISQFVMEYMGRKSKASWINKDIILFYKETPITYKIHMVGTGPGREGDPSISIDVSFPKTLEPHDVSEFMTSLMESGLGLTDENNLPPFEKPDLKTPRILRSVRIKQDEQRK